MAGTLGLIAGAGRLPLEMARAARQVDRNVLAVALRDLSDPDLETEADQVCWMYAGEFGRLLATLEAAGVREVVLAGNVSKTLLFQDSTDLRPDARALSFLAGLGDRRDDSILAALVSLLESEGIRVLPQAELVPQLLSEAGLLGRVSPTQEQRADVAFAWPIAKRIAGEDVGQCVVVKDRAVLAVEAIEGTDAAIRRAGQLGRADACVVKVAKPQQDPRFDLPTIGSGTLMSLRDAGAALLAFEARQTLVLDRSSLVEEADAAGIVLWAIPADGPEGSK